MLFDFNYELPEQFETLSVNLKIDATYRPGKYTGPPEYCYPDESEIYIDSVSSDDPDYAQESAAIDAWIAENEDKIFESAWEYFYQLMNENQYDSYDRYDRYELIDYSCN